MPNNFRLTGDYYVSKKGSNANDGLTPETPLLTIQAAIDKVLNVSNIYKTIIIGSGVYKETISKSFLSTVSTPTINFIGDGKVVLEAATPADNFTFIYSTYSANSYYTFTNIEFRNIYGIVYYQYQGSSFHTYNNCIFKNMQFAPQSSNSNYGYTIYFNSCQLINCNVNIVHLNNTYSYMGSIYINKCILINTYAGGIYNAIVGVGAYATTNGLFMAGVRQLINTYADSNSLIQLFSVAFSGRTDGPGNGAVGPYGSAYSTAFIDPSLMIIPSAMNNNNIQGKLMFGWNGYSSGTSSINTPISLDQAKIDYPLYTQRSFSSDPLFNDVAALNFTLQSSSPHIKAATDYTNIGGTEYAVYKSANSTEFTTGATVTNLFLTTNSYRITSPNTSGNVQSGAIFLQWPRNKPLTKIEWVGSLDFNKSNSGGTNGNTNVPDWDTYTTGAGASPDRLTVRMRFSTQQTQPSTSSEWDNGGLWTAGNWGLFEINQKPKVDGNGRGNGDPLYVETSGLGDIIPSWIQFDVKLIDNYNP